MPRVKRPTPRPLTKPAAIASLTREAAKWAAISTEIANRIAERMPADHDLHTLTAALAQGQTAHDLAVRFGGDPPPLPDARRVLRDAVRAALRRIEAAFVAPQPGDARVYAAELQALAGGEVPAL